MTVLKYSRYTLLVLFANEKTGRERGPATTLPGNPKFSNQDETHAGFRDQSQYGRLVVDPLLEELPVILWRKHRAWKRTPSS